MSKIAPEFAQAVSEAAEGRLLTVGGITRLVHDVTQIPGADQLPRALVTLLENVVRRVDDPKRRLEQAHAIVSAGLAGEQGDEIEFMPARVLFQDFTGVPVFVDFAAMRDAAVARGIDPALVNPKIPCTLIIDHSVIADEAGCPGCADRNEQLEVSRN